MSRWGSSILHADIDAFYASVEVLRDPSLIGKPVIVGGTSSRGVVTSASYEARRFGVTSAMPTTRARRLCPNGIFIQPDFSAYADKSRQVRSVFDAFSPVVEPLSLDEAFLDVSRARRLWPSPPAIAEALRHRVLRETGLTVSVGVAPNKFLAKLASATAKPDGVAVVDAKGVGDFLRPLPVGALWGVGEQTVAVLNRLGLKTVGDVTQLPPETLSRTLGALGTQIANLAHGIDDRRVIPDARRKSVGAEETFERDLVEDVQILQALMRLADRVSGRLRAEGISGRTVTLKARFPNFVTPTRSRTVEEEVDGAVGVYHLARDLLSSLIGFAEPGRKRLRLLGVSVSNLCEWPASIQLSFDRQPRWAEADRAIDRIRARFGDEAVGFASLMEDF